MHIGLGLSEEPAVVAETHSEADVVAATHSKKAAASKKAKASKKAESSNSDSSSDENDTQEEESSDSDSPSEDEEPEDDGDNKVGDEQGFEVRRVKGHARAGKQGSVFGRLEGPGSRHRREILRFMGASQRSQSKRMGSRTVQE